jgi:hypothetical protein
VIKTLAHAGLSISLSSIHCSVKSLSKEAEEKVRLEIQTLKTSVAYDNFDVHFKTSQPTLKHQSKFVSATLETLIPLFGVDDPSDLQRSRELWQADPRNPFPSQQLVQINPDNLEDLHNEYGFYFNKQDGHSLSLFLLNCAWHIRSMLVQHSPYFQGFASKLGQPNAIKQIPLHKTTQIPCRAMGLARWERHHHQ